MAAFTPTISDDHLLIVGHNDVGTRSKNAYKIPITDIKAAINQKYTYSCTKLTAANHYFTALVPSSSPPVVVGGHDTTGIADIKMYDNFNNSWKKIGSLSSARSMVAIAVVYNNAIVVIGGCTEGSMAKRQSSSLTVVELGQAELLD